jgi:predicted permease
MDGMLIFGGTIVAMDIMSAKDMGWRPTVAKIASNPPILGMLAGLIYGLSGLEIAPNVQIFLSNISSTASPVLLFALGVILSVKREEVITSLSGLIVFVKLIIHPVAAYFLLTYAMDVPRNICQSSDYGCSGTMRCNVFYVGDELWGKGR